MFKVSRRVLYIDNGGKKKSLGQERFWKDELSDIDSVLDNIVVEHEKSWN